MTVLATITDANYIGWATGTLVIGPGTILVTWPAPAPVTYGTPLSAAQLNVAGSFAYSLASGSVLSSGLSNITASFKLVDATAFTSVVKTVQLLVNRQGTVTMLTTSAVQQWGAYRKRLVLRRNSPTWNEHADSVDAQLTRQAWLQVRTCS